VTGQAKTKAKRRKQAVNNYNNAADDTWIDDDWVECKHCKITFNKTFGMNCLECGRSVNDDQTPNQQHTCTDDINTPTQRDTNVSDSNMIKLQHYLNDDNDDPDDASGLDEILANEISVMRELAKTMSTASNSLGVSGGIALPTDEALRAETPSPNDEMMNALRCLEIEKSEDDLMAMGFKTTRLFAALDSGAGEHVAGPEDVAGLAMRESAGSKAGRHFIAANGERIANIGEVPMKLKSKDGSSFNSVFQIADVTRPLYSVGRMCDAGCTVSFTKDQATVRKGAKVMAVFKRQGGLYVADLEVVNDVGKGNSGDDGTKTPFPRQGVNQ